MTEKKIVRSYQGFNAKLYNPKADIGEKNSGEVKVDVTGYVPLQELLKRCGIGQQLHVDFKTEPRLDKFNDNFDLIEDTKRRIELMEQQAIQNVEKRKNSVNSQQPQTSEVKNDGTIEKK